MGDSLRRALGGIWLILVVVLLQLKTDFYFFLLLSGFGTEIFVFREKTERVLYKLLLLVSLDECLMMIFIILYSGALAME